MKGNLKIKENTHKRNGINNLWKSLLNFLLQGNGIPPHKDVSYEVVIFKLNPARVLEFPGEPQTTYCSIAWNMSTCFSFLTFVLKDCHPARNFQVSSNRIQGFNRQFCIQCEFVKSPFLFFAFGQHAFQPWKFHRNQHGKTKLVIVADAKIITNQNKTRVRKQ